ncbi:double zinc ribbon domain-containing protein [Tautonia sociabilis]|uniref:ComF family protein n=1 Tax=Tautonia sociabilis TaxID=2080755 RepID=A0A432MCD1_9BACT|nr:double zinc ribbon domain-containing protein [Tautonia sociabilis]RUL81808.1 ComF family protein [Tautonia sociabilis]
MKRRLLGPSISDRSSPITGRVGTAVDRRCPSAGGPSAARGLGRLLGEAVGRLAFPMDCPVCAAPLEDRLDAFCAGCRDELLDAAGPACRRCAMPVGPFAGSALGCDDCAGRRLGFDAALALGPYQGPIRHLCLRLKTAQGAWTAPKLVEVLFEARRVDLLALGAEAVVPVPLHWRRRWQRGFDQAEALAAALADLLRLPMARPLRRVKPTEALWGLGRVERQAQMRGAFRADPRRMGPLSGRTVLLVDDILTTGATCGAASRALKAAGAGTVIAVVIARAEGRG